MPKHSDSNHAQDFYRAVRSWWSAEDDAFLAEVEGVPGTLIHGQTEEEARNAALEVAEEWRAVEQWLAQLSADEFIDWLGLDAEAAELLRSISTAGPTRRSLGQWNQLLFSLDGR